MSLRSSQGERIPTRQIDLDVLLIQIADELDLQTLSVYLFGSRKDRTGSIRSDVDLLLIADRPISRDEAEWIWTQEPYLDFFVLNRGIARSLVNESELRADDDAALILKLGAVELVRNGVWRSSANEWAKQTVLAERNPAATVVPMYDLYDAVPAARADILVVTALTEEYLAISAELGCSDVSGPLVTVTVRDEREAPWLVAIRNLQEMGSVGAAVKTQNALLRTKAAHVVLVGICAGIPGKVNLLDVIVPKTVLYFESAKRRGQHEERADQARECDEAVRARSALLTEVMAQNEITFRVTDEVLGCGEKVVASAEFRQAIQERHRKLVAIDMESYGVLRAAEAMRRRATVVKAVCDMADEEKGDDLHLKAAQMAARALHRMISRGAFREVP